MPFLDDIYRILLDDDFFMNLRKFLIPKKVELIFEMRLFKADFQTHFLMSRKPFSQFNVCEKLESGKLLQFIVFQTFDSKLFFEIELR